MNIVTPKIELVASTQLTNTQTGRTVIEELMTLDPSATDAENLIEYGGRGCYEQWSKPREATRKNKDYIRRTAFDMQHGSILEHASVTLRFSGVSRAWLTEMSRHRHLSWSVASQRYIDGEKFGVVMPPAIREATGNIVYGDTVGDDGAVHYLEDTYSLDGSPSEALEWWTQEALCNYESLVEHLEGNGSSRKQAREAARCVLPNCLETRGVVTGNLRAWSTILPLRAHPTADAEMREVARLITDALEPVAPTVVQNINEQIAYGEMSVEQVPREAILNRRNRHRKEHA